MARWKKPKPTEKVLRDASRRIENGYFEQGIIQANQALRQAQQPADLDAARLLLSEANLQIAFDEPEIAARVSRLASATEYDPLDPTARFYHALVLAQLGQDREALDLLGTLDDEPEMRGRVGYVRALCQLDQPKKARAAAPQHEAKLRLIPALLSGDAQAAAEAADAAEPGSPLWNALVAFVREDEDAARQLGRAAAQADAPPVARRLRYYQGAALMRQGDQDGAAKVWRDAAAGADTPTGLSSQMGALLRAEVLGDAEAGRWKQVAKVAEKLPEGVDDRILSETLGLAYFHLGYDAARDGKWSDAIEAWQKGARHHLTRHLAQNLALALEATERWAAAADAWRDMVRRRPRKESHPDYISDVQVAALWGRAARNYLRSERPDALEEAIRCVDTALKYAPDDIELRLQRADLLKEDRREDAAENELERILKIDPNHVQALIRLALLAEQGHYYWRRDPISLWRRAVKADPESHEAREGLANSYLNKLMPVDIFGPSLTTGQQNKLLKEALKDLPDHPMILLAAGLAYQDQGKTARAREHLDRSWQKRQLGQDKSYEFMIATAYLTLLLRFGDTERLEEVLPEVQAIPGLLPDFWTEQGADALVEKNLDYAERYFGEAEALVGQPHVKESKARVLARICEVAYERDAEDLAEQYAARIREEVPLSGAVEFIEAYQAWQREESKRTVLSLLRKATRRAASAKDESLQEMIESLKMQVEMPLPLDLMNLFMKGKNPF
jgi:tetratricopeptide (TPR) repeat protein